MKIILSLAFILICSFSFGQYGHWEKTTRSQWWPCKITWDQSPDKGEKNMPTDSGVVKMISWHFYRGPSDANVKVKDRWRSTKEVKDANAKPVDGVHHINYTDPNTGEKIQE